MISKQLLILPTIFIYFILIVYGLHQNICCGGLFTLFLHNRLQLADQTRPTESIDRRNRDRNTICVAIDWQFASHTHCTARGNNLQLRDTEPVPWCVPVYSFPHSRLPLSFTLQFLFSQTLGVTWVQSYYWSRIQRTWQNRPKTCLC